MGRTVFSRYSEPPSQLTSFISKGWRGKKKINVYELGLDMSICRDKTLGTDLESLSKASVVSSRSKLHLAPYVHRARSFSELVERMWRNGQKKTSSFLLCGKSVPEGVIKTIKLRVSCCTFLSGTPVVTLRAAGCV